MTQENVYEVLLRKDFDSYLRKVFSHLEGNREYNHNWHIDAMIHQVSRVISGECNRLVINLPPRHLKSICFSVALPTWLLGQDPTTRIMTLSYSDELAKHLSFLSRQVMESAWYRRAYPHTTISKHRHSLTELVTTRGGYRLAMSMSGGITGRGADYIIIDDPIKTGEAMSKTEREGVNAKFDSAVLSRLNDKRTGRVIVVMQRVHWDDLTGHILRKGGWKRLSLPAYGLNDQKISIGENNFYSYTKGEPLHAGREDLGDLKKIRNEIGSANFQSQYLQQPEAAAGLLVKREWFQIYPNDGRHEVSASEIIISIDTASKTGERNSYSAFTVWLVCGSRYYLRYVHRGRYEFPELVEKVKEMAETWGPDFILVEDASSGTALGQTLLHTTGLPVWGFRPKLDKVTRLQEASVFIEQKRVWLPDRASWREEFLDEVLSFPNSRFDDQVDSMVQFLLFMRKRMLVERCSMVTPIFSSGGASGIDFSELY